MNDSAHEHDTEIDDPIAAELHDHFHRRARRVHAGHDAPHPLAIRRAARERIAARHHRRVAGMSMSGAAAVAVAVALIVNAQAPQQVDTVGVAGPSPAAGVATGSSTGSATGAAKGWSTVGDDVAATSGYLPLGLDLPGTGTDALDAAYAMSTARGEGRAAPELAVLADLRAGQPVRFVVASPQDAEHLTDGKGGTEVTIAGRPARLIIANHGWHKVIWSIDDDTNVYVQSYGIDRAQLDELLATLTEDGQGGWSMDGGTTGLRSVETTPPEEQSELTIDWNAPATDGSHNTYTSLKQTGAGEYEFWASLVGYVANYSGTLRAVDVGLGDGATAAAVLWTSPGSTSGNWAQLTVLDPSGTVITVTRSRWAAEQSVPGAVIQSAADELAEAAPALFERLDESAWEALLQRAVVADAGDPEADRAGRTPTTTTPPPTTTDESGAGPDGTIAVDGP